MNEPNFKVTAVKEEKNYGLFEISPLPYGYGHTLGNAIRRILLGSLPGAAITSIRINGVKHQYSTFPGLKEDIIEFILNLKRIRLKLDGDKPAKMRLSVDKKQEVKASDIEVTSSIEIINKDLYLGSFMGGKKALEVDLVVEPGFGYKLGSARKIETVGVIPVDGIFSPVLRVSYKIEATRVGRATNSDKLIMEIWTDETISPAAALKESAKILISYFSQIYEPKEIVEEPVAITPSMSEDVLKMTIEELDLPARVANSLKKGGIETVGQLLGTPREELTKIKNVGSKSLEIIEEKLRERGVALKI